MPKYNIEYVVRKEASKEANTPEEALRYVTDVFGSEEAKTNGMYLEFVNVERSDTKEEDSIFMRICKQCKKPQILYGMAKLDDWSTSNKVCGSCYSLC